MFILGGNLGLNHFLSLQLWISGLLVLAIAACSGGGESQVRQSPFGRARTADLLTEGLRVETADLDFDNRPDQWTYYETDNNRIVRSERDIDFDGRIDLYEYFDSSGQVIEEEMNLDFDEAIDVVRFYGTDDVLARRELAVAFTGEFSVTKYYNAEGVVLRVERDSDGSGRVDTWEYFEDGQVVRVARDIDGDGAPDEMEVAP